MPIRSYIGRASQRIESIALHTWQFLATPDGHEVINGEF